MATTTKKLRLRRGDRRILESWVRSRTLPRRQVERAKVVLAASGGESSRGIAASVGIARDTARLWMRRYEAEGLDGIESDRPRSGRPRTVTRKVEEKIVQKTTGEDPPPEESTHWTSRLMGKALGIDHVTIWMVWRKYGLKPHQIRRFKLSRDPRLVEKLHDVVGVYMNPPDNAVVFSFDEKSQIQALDRTQPGLPLKKGRAGTMTHDYKRHGTTTLFAALNVATGHVIHACMPRHRHQEFLRFIKTVERSVDPDLEIHVILDNYATHKHEKVRNWLARNPRVHFHFVPTGASWANIVERLFGELDERQLKRLAVNSVSQLIHAINTYLDHRNEDPTPFVWTKSAQEKRDLDRRGLTADYSDRYHLLIEVGVPRDHFICARWYTSDRERPVFGDGGVVRAVQHENDCSHEVVDLAVHLHDSQFLEGHRLRLAVRITPEVETLCLRIRENVVEERVLVEEIDCRSRWNHEHSGNERRILLRDGLEGPRGPSDSGRAP